MDILVIAPHPDDETLGCGGTLLKHKANGDRIHWLIITCMNVEQGFSAERIRNRKVEIVEVSKQFQFDSVFELNYPSTLLDTIPMSDFVLRISDVIKEIKPEVVYLPHGGDIHSDHYAVYQSAKPCIKWFRYPSIKRTYIYETISETDFSLPDSSFFQPNVFINISEFIDKKIEIMKIYGGEMKEFPFPRSERAIRALAEQRGSQVGCHAAEAFMLLKEFKS
ncbi:PIG-L family deacetylase [Terasakiella sp. SH-1]|uniref:PIG-L deacetylase family protein n=1 Tax=Terasakiella sp. SH-1 TaxID=2560057 RepID=UPI001074053A|nr:PIG-L family deacetylase [Terasakiella sp. SH-1]